ncbi:hypothetical protein H0176_00530 [Methylorubrum populi]|uniref:Uncharacterized protein n=1 Tax=Methylorubrum rhodesianum TaxID=29427 RepID=A0ABU9Z5S7_9HYPH|nr:hypothetical protein [Methylorubrum rhodesianum]MBK3405098.1 hypothetical protein [Methylorubrum rhodesianum]MBY0138768.1 hypothetical protein [Methylorubrum populi]
MGAEVKVTRRDGSPELGYVCPECKEWSPVAKWREGEVYCEDCGDHRSMVCPACDEHTDTVFTDFEDADEFLKAEADAKAEAEWQAAEKATWDAYGKLIEPMEALRGRIQRTEGPGDEDLACAIAETMLGWRLAPVPPDIDGKNESEVLTETGALPSGWVPWGRTRYARGFFLPRGVKGIEWFTSIEGALACAKGILKPEMGLMWSRDAGGRFTLSERSPIDRWSGSSGPHVSTDALAIIDAAIAAKIARLRPEPRERPKPTRAMPYRHATFETYDYAGRRPRWSKGRV